VRRIFAQISPNLPEKNSKRITSKKMTAFHFIFGSFFSYQSTSSTIFAKCPRTCPKKTKKIAFKKFKSLHFDFGHHFKKSVHIIAKVFTHFAQLSTDFSLILRDFARIFTKSKLLGVRLHPLQTHLLYH